MDNSLIVILVLYVVPPILMFWILDLMNVGTALAAYGMFLMLFVIPYYLIFITIVIGIYLLLQ
ncbi:hypothetical protein [Acanthamoeba polyphaga mimivirus]|uniref:Uncharacterized protein n=3 Tax=Acanthamoeba polyphaga mimivirus TaxID=212035 RepID=E3VYQ6_MIMIV|nr:hypothetical protein MIMI_gp0973 [Acanthamoeba polyphaga mimivirus]AEQ61129.1 putative membrane protein [Acanthamoeba castellanii mamavirus]AHA44911.1 hypothetical protein HIRU_S5 [Hirudovirus strain Sangsue]QTF49858.1 hypothetical protein [Mimivirus reunion]WMV62301.1 hypothetical protein qu_967 [Mimivirus sp.]ADO18935.1 hypothetical protein [Acanthamoeba polyphaga mimivirus]